MASMLELPWELYLLICNFLTPIELTRLAGVSRDHYLAVQQPLFSRVQITSFGALVKLVGTLLKAPIVSRISPKYAKLAVVRDDMRLTRSFAGNAYIGISSAMNSSAKGTSNSSIFFWTVATRVRALLELWSRGVSVPFLGSAAASRSRSSSLALGHILRSKSTMWYCRTSTSSCYTWEKRTSIQLKSSF